MRKLCITIKDQTNCTGFFFDSIDEENRKKFEIIHQDEITGVEIETIFIGT